MKKTIIQIVGWFLISIGMLSIILIKPEFNPNVTGLIIAIVLFIGQLFIAAPDTVIILVNKIIKQKIDPNI